MKNRKLCWNCGGSVHVRATKCPFCSTELTAEVEQPPASEQRAVPPYPFTPASQQQAIPQPPYGPPVEEEENEEELVPVKKPGKEDFGRTVVLPMLLLLPGAYFLLFATILLLFGKDGALTLKWNAHYWWVYLISAVPLLYFGWKSLNKAEPVSTEETTPH